MKEKTLSKRLQAVFEFVREGRIVADIGTDHAYLPIALIRAGKASRLYASDIGKGPLKRAEENIKKAGLEDKIETVLTDGLEYFERLADEFIIAGMGGELIFDIISRAPFLKNKDTHLVLQPMTKIPELRKSLFESGFEIKEEKLIFEDSKVYTVMSVYYAGEKRTLSDLELTLGDIKNADRELLLKVINLSLYDLENKIKGKKDAIREKELKNSLLEIKEKLYENI